MGFEPTRAEHNGLAVHRLNLSATSSPQPLLWQCDGRLSTLSVEVRLPASSDRTFGNVEQSAHTTLGESHNGMLVCHEKCVEVTKEYEPSRGWFRSIDLWVMGPARFRCATLLFRRKEKMEGKKGTFVV